MEYRLIHPNKNKIYIANSPKQAFIKSLNDLTDSNKYTNYIFIDQDNNEYYFKNNIHTGGSEIDQSNKKPPNKKPSSVMNDFDRYSSAIDDDEAIQNINIELNNSSLNKELSDITKKIAEFQKKLDIINDKIKDLEYITKSYDIKQSRLSSYLNDLDKSRLEKTMLDDTIKNLEKRIRILSDKMNTIYDLQRYKNESETETKNLQYSIKALEIKEKEKKLEERIKELEKSNKEKIEKETIDFLTQIKQQCKKSKKDTNENDLKSKIMKYIDSDDKKDDKKSNKKSDEDLIKLLEEKIKKSVINDLKSGKKCKEMDKPCFVM